MNSDNPDSLQPIFFARTLLATVEKNMKTTFADINDVQKEVRLKDEQGHFLAIKRNGRIFVYCKRCKEFLDITDFKEGRLKDRCGHFLAERRGNALLIYCKRCKKFYPVIMEEETK
jgi:hypothetical protein